MSRPAKQVEGVYEKVKGSGVWYTRLRVDGKLVCKAIGSRVDAIAYVEKARTIRRTGAGVLPTSAKNAAQTTEELDRVGGAILISEALRFVPEAYSRPTQP